MAKRCGIDLGTTYSSISCYDADNQRVVTVQLVTMADGQPIIRSVVYYPGNNQPPVVGDTAWNAARQFPERVVVGIKRSMGTSFKVAIDGVEYSPQEVSAEILKVLVKEAEAYLGEQVTDVVITVPAYFGDNERAATLEAGKLAGLNVLGLLPEPHAAALAFTVPSSVDAVLSTIVEKDLLVYDLGGGTFDVTLIHATATAASNNAVNLEFKTLCKDGNAARGGLDWDRALADIVADKVAQQHGVDIRLDTKNEPFLLDNCEKAKRHLSRVNSYSIIADMAGHAVDVSVAEFEERTRPLLLETQMLLEKVIEDAQKQHGLPKERIDVMLTGGASKMPMVAKMVEGVMGKAPIRHQNPELLVTIGAAYWAHLVQAAPGPQQPSPPPPAPIDIKTTGANGQAQNVQVRVNPGGLTDVSVYAVGVEVVRPDGYGGFGRFNAVVVPAGAPYNQQYPKEFRKVEDNMREIVIALYKGDSPDLSQCEHLATFTITGLPSGGKRGEPVNVTLGYDGSGILRGEAVDVVTGNKVDIEVKRPI